MPRALAESGVLGKKINFVQMSSKKASGNAYVRFTPLYYPVQTGANTTRTGEDTLKYSLFSILDITCRVQTSIVGKKPSAPSYATE